MVEMNSFCRWWKTKEPCDSCLGTNPSCKGTDGTLSIFDFTANAGWRDTIVSHDEYIRTEPAVSPFSVIEGCPIHRMSLFVMPKWKTAGLEHIVLCCYNPS